MSKQSPPWLPFFNDINYRYKCSIWSFAVTKQAPFCRSAPREPFTSAFDNVNIRHQSTQTVRLLSIYIIRLPCVSNIVNRYQPEYANNTWIYCNYQPVPSSRICHDQHAFVVKSALCLYLPITPPSMNYFMNNVYLPYYNLTGYTLIHRTYILGCPWLQMDTSLLLSSVLF